MTGVTELQPALHIVIPQGVLMDAAMADIASILAKNGYGVAETAGIYGRKRNGRKEIDMEWVYEALDGGMKMEELLGRLNVTYQTLSRRHQEYQENLPEEERRTELVKYKATGRPYLEIPMEWVYDQIDAGRTVKEVADELRVGTRTLYSRHDEFQERLKRDGKGKHGPYARKTLTDRAESPLSGRPKKEIDMEAVYEELLSGTGICEAAKKHDVSSITLKAKHEEYQREHQGESGRYIRKRLKDFKNAR